MKRFNYKGAAGSWVPFTTQMEIQITRFIVIHPFGYKTDTKGGKVNMACDYRDFCTSSLLMIIVQ